jgi:hypothetical protein
MTIDGLRLTIAHPFRRLGRADCSPEAAQESRLSEPKATGAAELTGEICTGSCVIQQSIRGFLQPGNALSPKAANLP